MKESIITINQKTEKTSKADKQIEITGLPDESINHNKELYQKIAKAKAVTKELTAAYMSYKLTLLKQRKF